MLWQVKPLRQRSNSPVSLPELFCCVLSAALLTLSLPNYNLGFLAWCGFVPLFLVIETKPIWKAFILSYLTGFIFWWGCIYWLVHVTLLGAVIFIFYLALYFGIFGLIISSMNYGLKAKSYFFIPALWVILEYIRSHFLTGFPWALLAYSQYLYHPLIQIADFSGAWGVSFLVMMGNVAIKEIAGARILVIDKNEQKRLQFSITVFFLCLIFTIGYGYYRLQQKCAINHQIPIKISVVQPNIAQELKWDIRARDFIINRYAAISRQAAEVLPDLIIWPEAALPAVVQEEPLYYRKVIELVTDIKTPLLMGAVTSSTEGYGQLSVDVLGQKQDNPEQKTKDKWLTGSGLHLTDKEASGTTDFSPYGFALNYVRYYNSALLISDKGRLLGSYDKLHLVPFGEYVPLRKVFHFLETIAPIGDITPGKDYTVFSQYVTCASGKKIVKFAVLICFEDLFPELSREFVKRGAQFLVNITNDAWYKHTSAPYQHMVASVFRAVENRVYVARCANTGVSGFIDPCGKIVSLVKDASGRNIFVCGYLTESIAAGENSPTFYTKYSDIFVGICALFMLYSIMSIVRNKRHKSNITQAKNAN